VKLDEMRLAVHPGQGLVARFERTVLLVLGNPPPGTAEKLVDACRTADTAADRLRELGQASGTPAAAFFALVEQESTWQLFMAGAMKVSVAMEKSRREFDSTDPQGWVEETLRGEPVSVSVAEKALKAGSQPLSDLIAGVVPGGAIELLDRSAAVAAPKAQAAAATKPRPTPKPDEGTAFIPKAAVSEDDARTSGMPGFEQQATMASVAMPRPVAVETEVEGRPCVTGHLNDPLAPICRVCGGEVLDQVARGPRPALGSLLDRDGAVVAVLDHDYLIGRKPGDAPEVASGAFFPIEVPVDQAGVSRIHAEIRIAEWTVLLTDRRSANGTFIRPAGVNEWIRLEAGHTVQVVPGTGISLGPYELQFDART
jgi:FHA domain